MVEYPTMITNAQIKKIKTLQRVCCLDDDTYRDILRNKGGVNSSRDLRSKRQIDSVMLYLSELAEKVDKRANRKAADWKWENSKEGQLLREKSKKVSKRENRPSLQQLEYIWGLWWSLRSEWKKGKDSSMETSLNHFLSSGRAGKTLKIGNWQWLTYDMGHQFINVLKGRVAQPKKKSSNKRQ